MLLGYAGVSTREQNLHRQLDALTAAGCDRIWQEKLSGKNADRPELQDCLAFARPNDVVTVTELWRLGRNFQDLIQIVSGLHQREIGFKSLHEALDTTTPGGRMIFHIFAALGEFIREMIVQGTREGLDAAKARGTRLGRPPAMTSEQVQHARDLLGNPDNTVSSIARLLGVSRATIYKYVPELRFPAVPGASAPLELSTAAVRRIGRCRCRARHVRTPARPAGTAPQASTSSSCTARASKPSGSSLTRTSPPQRSWSAGTANAASPTRPTSSCAVCAARWWCSATNSQSAA
ncbi:DNA invertase Pin-like site-specific DNA recombinase [Kribbella pratensis]|uniref:DNA invertase Pin-like site-specific DNA recombinase n=2 Tax=Kribbella pratensis TaxID=2512112 RepID=A0ABY2F811_9ACTN|nr:DNA invertase Pin-like site-specific DNA recombinase [Kribbella pratensis]